MNTAISSAALIAALVALIVAALYRKKLQAQHDTLMIDYRPVDALKTEVFTLSKTYSDLQEKYKVKRSALQTFEGIISTYNLGVGTIDVSTYTPIHDTRDVSVLEAELEKVKEKAKTIVSAKRACISHLPSNIAINGRKGAAKTFINREIRLRIRCLDNEVKAAIAAAEWNNINRLIERVQNKFQEINDESKLVKIFLEKDYLDIKVLELRLNYEIKQLKTDLKEEEREERQRIREEERDEERVKKELEKAERDRARMEKLVEQELAKISEATDAQKEKLALHQKELELLRAKEARAISLAQQTRAGYVYIISNTTSFGEGICKIGMTRRLDPNDRVKELGDASVPEFFTVHAFIYTDDAPTLEKHFHDHFKNLRVNLVNRRKEFFRLAPEDALKALKNYEGNYNLEATG
ncbi:MAG: hypothetical protein CVV05_11270 [Gammaproteobacteria bacterium HGW-Gammaproteobacteria-1]|jgi:DNA repair exonuclease SbcCD ATPase subunit|nr:MAG: hypothetical protein CVV05_11270 [Gammaproteobacteria bacterium HGW-Gammaproteobacteria-1]